MDLHHRMLMTRICFTHALLRCDAFITLPHRNHASIPTDPTMYIGFIQDWNHKRYFGIIRNTTRDCTEQFKTIKVHGTGIQYSTILGTNCIRHNNWRWFNVEKNDTVYFERTWDPKAGSGKGCFIATNVRPTHGKSYTLSYSQCQKCVEEKIYAPNIAYVALPNGWYAPTTGYAAYITPGI